MACARSTGAEGSAPGICSTTLALCPTTACTLWASHAWLTRSAASASEPWASPLPVTTGLTASATAIRHPLIDSPSSAGTPHAGRRPALRSEEHTSELQSHSDLVCRLLLEKKNRDDPAQRHAGC